MAPMTRSMTRSSNVNFVSLPYRKVFNCIVCKEGFHTKKLLTEHFAGTHRALPCTQSAKWHFKTLPALADPSCWPKARKLTKKEVAAFQAKQETLEFAEPASDASIEHKMAYYQLCDVVKAHA